MLDVFRRGCTLSRAPTFFLLRLFDYKLHAYAAIPFDASRNTPLTALLVEHSARGRGVLSRLLHGRGSA